MKGTMDPIIYQILIAAFDAKKALLEVNNFTWQRIPFANRAGERTDVDGRANKSCYGK